MHQNNSNELKQCDRWNNHTEMKGFIVNMDTYSSTGAGRLLLLLLLLGAAPPAALLRRLPVLLRLRVPPAAARLLLLLGLADAARLVLLRLRLRLGPAVAAALLRLRLASALTANAAAWTGTKSIIPLKIDKSQLSNQTTKHFRSGN